MNLDKKMVCFILMCRNTTDYLVLKLRQRSVAAVANGGIVERNEAQKHGRQGLRMNGLM